MTEAEALGISEATYGGGTGQTSAPDTGLAGLGVSTPAYGRSGMDFDRALDALIGMQAYPYIPPEPSRNIAGIRGIPSAGMLAENPVYGFREPVTAHPADIPTGFFDRYSLDEYDYPASVAPSATRSLAPVAGVTTPTQPAGVNTDYDALAEISRINAGSTPPSFDRQTLNELSRMGYGSMEGANPNNPTQTVDQMIAANNVSNFLDKYAPTIMGVLTGYGPQMNAIRMGADVLSGKATPGQALTGLGLDYIAGKAGLPGGGPVLGDLLEGRMDRAASGLTQAGLAAALGRAAGIPAPIAGIPLKESGLGPKAGAAVGKAVGPSQPTGATSSLTQIFDKGLGGLKEIFSGVPQLGAGTAGTAPTAQTAGVPYYGYASDSSPDSPATVAAPAAPAAPTTPEVQAAQRLLYGLAQGPYGPLLAYDIGERG